MHPPRMSPAAFMRAIDDLALEIRQTTPGTPDAIATVNSAMQLVSAYNAQAAEQNPEQYAVLADVIYGTKDESTAELFLYWVVTAPGPYQVSTTVERRAVSIVATSNNGACARVQSLQFMYFEDAQAFALSLSAHHKAARIIAQGTS